MRNFVQKARRMGSGLPIFFSESKRLPSGGFGLAKLRDDAELLHHAQSVPVDPAFHDLAASEAGDAYAGDVDLLAGWRMSAKIALMGTAARPAGHHGFAFGNEILDRQAH